MQDTNSQMNESRADRFWSFFLFTKNGRVKNPLIIYSFSISFVLLAIYGIAYWFLLDPVHLLFNKNHAWVLSLMESFLPALAGCAFICLIQKISGNKRFIPLAHIWMLLYALFTLVFMLTSLEAAEEKRAFFSLFLRVIPIPVLLGGLSSWMLYRKSGKFDKHSKLLSTSPGSLR